MSLTQRKARPLNRDSVSLRDDRLFIIACDDTYAPEQYFNFLNITRIKIHVVPTTDGTSSAKHVLERLLEFDYENDDERWMLLDTDHYTKNSHIKSFIQAIKEAKRSNVKIALSKPCFEIWLLLHHVDKSMINDLTNAKETENLLRKKLGEYNKNNLKQKHYPLNTIVDACISAKELDTTDRDIPENNTSRIYLLLKSIAAKGLPSQLPDELRKLNPESG